MPYASARLRQWMPARQHTCPASMAAANATTYGATRPAVRSSPAMSRATTAATASGGR